MAIKYIPVYDQPLFLRSLFREIKILYLLSKLKNNIYTIKLKDAFLKTIEDKVTGVVIEGVYLVTEYYEFSLRDMLDKVPNVSESQASIIGYNLLCSINYIHSANILHRDLKPANILIT